MEFLIAFVGPLLLGFIPLMVYVHKGRKSGKVSPKLAATLIALGCIAIPYVCMGILLRISSLQYWGVGMFAFLLVWLSIYIGPMGAGLTGKWDNYVYPQRKKENKQSLVTETKASVIPIKSHRPASWRLLILEILLGEIIFIGVLFYNSLF